jgi:ACS family pantothenate transporter-like MFS transporter
VNVGNAEERALTISSMNGLFYATNSFLPILIFPQTMAPKFQRGFPSLLSFALAGCGFMRKFPPLRNIKAGNAFDQWP